MIKCTLCDKKLVTKAQMDKHVLLAHPNGPEESPVVTEEESKPSEVAQAPETNIVSDTPIESEAVELRFLVPVQVTINGKKYPETEGKVIIAPNMETAGAIVRLIRESQYGDVLER